MPGESASRGSNWVWGFFRQFSSALPEFWLYGLGALFVLVTLFLPRGIVGLLPGRGKDK